MQELQNGGWIVGISLREPHVQCTTFARGTIGECLRIAYAHKKNSYRGAHWHLLGGMFQIQKRMKTTHKKSSKYGWKWPINNIPKMDDYKPPYLDDSDIPVLDDNYVHLVSSVIGWFWQSIMSIHYWMILKEHIWIEIRIIRKWMILVIKYWMKNYTHQESFIIWWLW